MRKKTTDNSGAEASRKFFLIDFHEVGHLVPALAGLNRGFARAILYWTTWGK